MLDAQNVRAVAAAGWRRWRDILAAAGGAGAEGREKIAALEARLAVARYSAAARSDATAARVARLERQLAAANDLAAAQYQRAICLGEVAEEAIAEVDRLERAAAERAADLAAARLSLPAGVKVRAAGSFRARMTDPAPLALVPGSN